MIVVYQTFMGRGLYHYLDDRITHAVALIEPSECLWMVPNLRDPYGQAATL